MESCAADQTRGFKEQGQNIIAAQRSCDDAHFTADARSFTRGPASRVSKHKTGTQRRPALDLSELAHLGVDEMNCRKGHNYLTVFADLVARRVVIATECKDHTTFQRFAEEIVKHASSG